jgi:hypothetical protein
MMLFLYIRPCLKYDVILIHSAMSSKVNIAYDRKLLLIMTERFFLDVLPVYFVFISIKTWPNV